MNSLVAMFSHILYSSLLASILILLVLAIKKILNDRLSARVYHILWVIVLIRLLMPMEIASPFSIFNLIPSQIQTSLAFPNSQLEGPRTASPEAEDHITTDQPTTASSDNTHSFLWRNLSVIWIIGVLSLSWLATLITIRSKQEMKRAKKVDAPELHLLLEQCNQKLKISKSLPLYMHSRVRSPCIAGILRPSIHLSSHLYDKIDSDQLRDILLHELSHYKRKDLFVNFLTILATLLHWFNPLIWWSVKEMRNARELACDAYVMEILEDDKVISYGMTMLDLSRLIPQRKQILDLVSFHASNSQLERRINMIKNFKKGSYKLSIAVLIGLIAIGAMALTNTWGLFSSIDNGSAMAPNDKIKQLLVIVDPGHGGDDLGATYPFDLTGRPTLIQVQEKDLNLDIARKLYDRLQKSGMRVEMTRSEDRNMSLQDRLKLAHDLDAALFISVHNGNYTESSRNGTSALFNASVDTDIYGISGERAAQLVQEETLKNLETADLGINPMPNSTVFNAAKMPTVTMEIAYISNDSDRKNLMDEEFRNQAAQGLHDGIIKILNEMAAAD